MSESTVGWIVIALLAVGFVVVFIWTHVRPLTDGEIGRVGGKRRRSAIRRYFMFDNTEHLPDLDLKKRMNPDGKVYKVSVRLFSFPSYAAALLKYKKHEWIVFAFEEDQTVLLIWANKGLDKTSVTPFVSPESLVSTAVSQGFQSIMVFHNHPNPDPRTLNCLLPSDQDHRAAQYRSQYTTSAGLNLLEFVCERGRHLEYARFISEKFLPQQVYDDCVRSENGRSKPRNLALHIERLLG